MLLDGFKFASKYPRKNIYDKKRLCVNYSTVCSAAVTFIVRLGKMVLVLIIIHFHFHGLNMSHSQPQVQILSIKFLAYNENSNCLTGTLIRRKEHTMRTLARQKLR